MSILDKIFSTSRWIDGEGKKGDHYKDPELNYALTRKFTLGAVQFPMNQSFLDQRMKSLGLILGKISTLSNPEAREYFTRFFTIVLFEHQAASYANQKKYTEASKFIDEMSKLYEEFPCCYYYSFHFSEKYPHTYLEDMNKFFHACEMAKLTKNPQKLSNIFIKKLTFYKYYIEQTEQNIPVQDYLQKDYNGTLPETRRIYEVMHAIIDSWYKPKKYTNPQVYELCSLPESLKTLKESTENLEKLSMDNSHLDNLLIRIFELSKIKNKRDQEDKLNEYNSLVRQFVLGPVVFPTDQSILNRRMELLNYVGSRILACTNPEAKDYLTKLFQLIFWEHQAASYANQKEYGKAKKFYDAVFNNSRGFYDDYCKKSSDFHECDSWIDASSEACKILQSKKLKGDFYTLRYYLEDFSKLPSGSYRKYFSEIHELEESIAKELKQSGIISGFDRDLEYLINPLEACKRENSDGNSQSLRQHLEQQSQDKMEEEQDSKGTDFDSEMVESHELKTDSQTDPRNVKQRVENDEMC